ncbi:hypothetical protein HLB03_03070 [Acidianus sp. DSM 29099]|nr:hypothetical protein [Acidianus sp. RZ1]
MKRLILGLIALVLTATFVEGVSSRLVNITHKASSPFSMQSNAIQLPPNSQHSN